MFSKSDEGDIIYSSPFITALPTLNEYEHKKEYLAYLEEIGYLGYNIYSSDSLNNPDEYYENSEDLVYEFPTYRLIIPLFL